MSNAPTVLFGLVPLVRAVVRSSATATTTTATPDDSGSLFVNMSTSAHAYTLPAVAAGKGKCFIFFNGEGTQTISVASTAANLKCGDATATTALTSTTAIGDSIIIIGDGTYYYGFVIYGTWGNT